jgi:anaerobic magnesium-protoporphyrin IX monomethyl ester cyclase
MTSVLLIYPFFIPARDRSVFRFPPLGVAYIAASLREAGHSVKVLDCTFLQKSDALSAARAAHAQVIGIYCMVTMLEDCLWFAKELRDQCRLLIAGGPLPTCDPLPFLERFDIVVRGEGEQTMTDILQADAQGSDFGSVAGIVYRARPALPDDPKETIAFTPHRPFEKALDRLPFPARDLLPNEEYIRYAKKKYGYSITTVMSTRGCPYQCEFCSNVVFGGSYRERSAARVVDEIEDALQLGYERISFADDVFTMNRRRVLEVCQEIHRRGLQFNWECLGRVDAIDLPTAAEMKRAGCTRIYFGIESGDDRVLKLMNKKITTAQARAAVEAAHQAGLEVGAFFILFYPGETDDTVLATLRFAASLPLDYIGLSMPYPLPGTALYDRVRDQITRPWRAGEHLFGGHVLTYHSEFSEAKMWFGIIKGHAQFKIKRRMGRLAPLVLKLIETPSDALLKLMR